MNKKYLVIHWSSTTMTTATVFKPINNEKYVPYFYVYKDGEFEKAYEWDERTDSDCFTIERLYKLYKRDILREEYIDCNELLVRYPGCFFN